MVRVKNDRVKPVFGGSGLIPGRGSSLFGKYSATSSSLHYLRDNPNDLYSRGTDKDPIPVSDSFTSWIDTLSADVESAIDKLNEEETKPSPPIIDWMEGTEDELPF